MNNAIDYAIGVITRQIPPQLLRKVFVEKDRFSAQRTVSPEYMIRHRIIEQIIIPDCNVMGGQHVDILTYDLPKQLVQSGFLIEIPLEKTQGQHLTSVQVIGMDNGGLSVDSSIGGMASAIINQAKGYRSGFTNQVRLVGPNMVLVENIAITHTLRGTIGYDNRISSLDKFYWNDFARLCVLATKALIYNDYILELGFLNSSGSTPNQYLVSTVEGYQQAQEDYQTMINEEMSKILILADPLAKRDHLKLATGRF